MRHLKVLGLGAVTMVVVWFLALGLITIEVYSFAYGGKFAALAVFLIYSYLMGLAVLLIKR